MVGQLVLRDRVVGILLEHRRPDLADIVRKMPLTGRAKGTGPPTPFD